MQKWLNDHVQSGAESAAAVVRKIRLVAFPHLVGRHSKFVPGASYCNPCLSVAAILIPSKHLSCCFRKESSLLSDAGVEQTHLSRRFLRPDVPWAELTARIPSRILLGCQSRAALKIGSAGFLCAQEPTTVLLVGLGWHGR
jgi:hypothetical protein